MFSKNRTAPYSIKWLEQNRRNAFRLSPTADELCMEVKGQAVQIINISSSGVAFSFADESYSLQPSTIEITATLSVKYSETTPIHATLKVLSSKDGVYRCQMLVQQRGFNSLCQYLVKHQIANIRKLQKNKIETSRQA